jgi:hypothetical protein
MSQETSSIVDRTKDVSGLILYTRAQGDVLYSTLSGEFRLADALSAFLQLLGAIKEGGSSKVLVDGRRVSGEPITIERFLYGEFVAEAVKKLETGEVPMFAYVLHEPVLDPMRLGETVAINRGMNVRVFDDYELAIAWLGVMPPIRSQPYGY